MLFIFELIKMAVQIRKITLFIVTTLFLVSSSYIIHWLEPETFPSPFIGFWYVMTTVTTTGYGDVVPQTMKGKIFGLFLYMFGIGLIGIVIGKIVEGFGIYQRLKEEGKLSFNGNGHYVIIGWSNKAKFTINEIFQMDENANVVLIDSQSKKPTEDRRPIYVQGDPTDTKTLDQANVLHAKSVIIFTEDHEYNPVAADGKSLLIVSAIESYAARMKKAVYTIVEIRQEKHIPNFKHANVDEFMITDEALSDLMAKSAVDKGASKIIMRLLNRGSGIDLLKIKKQPVWATYNDAFEDLKKVGANLISDRDDFNVLKKLDEPIPNDAELFIICNEEAYQKLMGIS